VARLGKVLVSLQLITPDQLRQGVAAQILYGGRLGTNLVELSFLDLDTLAKRVGLGRFQALRAFRQRYGLPPHTYQLCLRVSHARGLLREGLPAADVATRCGFADQSHFTRHFKRINAITPVQYARTKAPSIAPDSATLAFDRSPGALLTRSDR